MEKDLLNANDISTRLGVTVSRVHQMIRAGQLPSCRFGRAVRIPRPAFERWVEAKAQEATASLVGVPGEAPAHE